MQAGEGKFGLADLSVALVSPISASKDRQESLSPGTGRSPLCLTVPQLP